MRFILILMFAMIHGCGGAYAAIVTPTVTRMSQSPLSNPTVARWASVTSSDTSVAVLPGAVNHMSFQTSGTFAGSGTLILDGSNDCVTYYALKESASSAVVSMTTAGLSTFTGRAKCIRPRMSGGSSGTEVFLYYSN